VDGLRGGRQWVLMKEIRCDPALLRRLTAGGNAAQRVYVARRAAAGLIAIADR